MVIMVSVISPPTEYSRNICHLCDACELRQGVMVAPYRSCLTIFFRYDHLWSWLGPMHTVHLLSKHFYDWWICNCYTERFMLILCYIGIMLFWIEFSTQFAVETFFKIGKSMIATQNFSCSFLCYIGIMLFWIEFSTFFSIDFLFRTALKSFVVL